MKPAFFCPEIGASVESRLRMLLLTMLDLTNTNLWPNTEIGCAHTFTVVGNLGSLISEAKHPTFKGSIEDWALEVLGENHVSNPSIKPILKPVFEAIGDVLTEIEDSGCITAMNRAESLFVRLVADHFTNEALWYWANDYAHPSVRDRRVAFVKEVQEERHERAVRAANPSGARHAKDLWPRDRRSPPPRPSSPPPPPPPPTPVLPPEDLSTAGRRRLCEVLSHPTNLGLLGVERVDPAMPLNQLRALVRLLEGGAR